MFVSHDHRARDLEDVLRSLGAVLDAHLATAILIREVDGGLMVRARVSPTLGHRIGGVQVALERIFSEAELAEQQRDAVARRGSGHRAGPIERSLRSIGRLSDDRELADLVLIEREGDGAWLLWHAATLDGRPELLAFTPDELEQLDTDATSARAGDQAGQVVATAEAATPL